MIITCPSCSANYRLKAEIINPATGRVVRCSACGGSWRVFPPKKQNVSMGKIYNKHKPVKKSKTLPWVIGILLFNVLLFSLGYFFRKDIVQAAPQTERFYQILGIDVNITGISLIMPYLEKVNHEDGHVSLLIQGSFLNSHPKKTLKIQPLRITLLNNANLPIQTLTKSDFNPEFLLSGGRSDFTYEIPNLPQGAVDVRIEFDSTNRMNNNP